MIFDSDRAFIDATDYVIGAIPGLIHLDRHFIPICETCAHERDQVTQRCRCPEATP